jgi:hypothetical protein
MERHEAMAAFFLVASYLCGGCGQSLQPIEVQPRCPNQPLRGPMQFANEPGDQLITDFESESGTLDLAKVGGRNGQWVLGWEYTSGVPIPVNAPSSRCPARGKWAGHYEAGGWTSWGTNWTAIFRDQPDSVPLPYDGQAYGYGAISFWAAFGGDTASLFDVAVGITTMDTAWNSSGCTTCNDFYRAKVSLSREWQRFVVRFDDMAQSGSGVPQVAMRRDQLVGFIIWPDQYFDIWIDDVRFEP